MSKKIIYYVIEKSLQNSNYAGEEYTVEETTGYKTVRAYEIQEGKLQLIMDLHFPVNDSSEEEIIDYMTEQGMYEDDGDPTYKTFYEKYQLIEL